MLEISVILFRFNLNLSLFDLLMGEPETPPFYDFGTFERVHGSPNKLFFIFGDTKTPKTNQEQSRDISIILFS